MPNKRFTTTNQFDKQLAHILKEQPEIEELIFESFNLFLEDRKNPVLRDHPLRTKMQGLRSFSISFDLRVIYREKEDVYIFRYIGSHKDVYKY